jgi:lactaldehyde dehydrogenase/glycolaldehyde dehydrogenase
VIVAILPWNFPLALFVRKVAPALLTGNTVVLKPSEATPVVALEMMKLAEACDLPAGVLNVVVGEREIGEALVASPIAGLVTLTGSTRAGKAVMAAAAGNLTQVSLELGGKAPAIVWTDADLDLAVDSILQARHMNTGQVCTCAERVFVHESRFDDFVSAYSKGVEGLTMGDPAGEFDLGPLVSETQRDKVVASTEQALASGATAVVEGGIPTDGDFQNGSWIKPTVLVDVDPEMKVMTDETFGPVTPIVPVSSLDQVVDFANESRAALASYVFSFDTRVIRHFTRRMDAGEVYVNRSIGEALQAFHSGHKESGIGGEDGRHGVLKYTNIRSVYERFPD